MQLICGGLGLLGGLDADEAAETTAILKLHEARDHGVQRVVLAVTDIFARLMLGAAFVEEPPPFLCAMT